MRFTIAALAAALLFADAAEAKRGGKGGKWRKTAVAYCKYNADDADTDSVAGGLKLW